MSSDLDVKSIDSEDDLSLNGIPAERLGSGPVYVIAGRWSVEYNSETQKKLFDKLKEVANNFIFQAEDTKNNPHYQIYMNLKTKVRPKQLAKSWNAEFKGIELRPASNEGKDRLKKYCMKSETRVAGPWSDKPIYLGKDLPKVLRPWQQALFEFLKTDPDDREVVWIYDPIGKTGKSKFLKYMGYHHGACTMGYGQSKDLVNLVSKNMGKNMYLFNLTRVKPEEFSKNDLFATIEAIKDGVIVNMKYDTSVQYMDPPHVVVFANYVPPKEKLSLDRWKIFLIEDQKLVYKK